MAENEETHPYHDARSHHVTFQGRAFGDEESPDLEGVFPCTLDGTLHPGVVLCHANPAAGGNMDMKVMLAIEKALAGSSFATLRYNSRGVGASAGAVSRTEGKKLVAPEGEPEVGDVGAALDFIGRQGGVDSARLALVGHSFGARIALAYVAAHAAHGVKAVTCIGLPVAWRDLGHLGQWPHPRLFVTGELDDFCPPAKLAQYVETLPQPRTMLTLRNTGHFFEGREDDLALAVLAFLKQVLT